jgi:ribonuclease HI
VEVLALTKPLELGVSMKINIYKDSRYAFATVRIHGSIYQERGLLTSEGQEIKNKQEILDLLDALMKLTTVSIIH